MQFSLRITNSKKGNEMTKLRIGQKAQRTGKLLFGLNNPRVAAKLEPFGYSGAVHQEGWGLLTIVSQHRLATDNELPKNPQILVELDEFENLWFPLAKAMLDRKYSGMSDALFGNLNRTAGQSVAISVTLFVRRLDAMDKGEEPFGEQGPEAREYLRSRGLTDEVVAAAQEHLDAVRDLRTEPAPDSGPSAAEALEAEEAMWKWYLEWSTIARTVIKDGHLLRSLGFKKRKGRNSSSDDIVETDDPGEVTELPESEALALPAAE